MQDAHRGPSEKGLMVAKVDQSGSASTCCRVVKRNALPSTLFSTMPPGSTGATGGTILHMPAGSNHGTVARAREPLQQGTR